MGSQRGGPNEVLVDDETFSATLIVNRARTTRKANDGGYFDAPPVYSNGQLAKVELTATTLVNLQLKIKQHVDLLEDE